MSSLTCTFLTLFVLTYIIYYYFCLPPDIPEVDANARWGNDNGNIQDENVIYGFKIDVSKQVINELNQKLNQSRIKAAYFKNSSNKYGTNIEFLREIIRFWRNEYNWTERQEYLNKFPQFITKIQGIDIHFIHIKPRLQNAPKKSAPAVLLLHGWPGSVREFYGVIEFLQARSLELVVPSIPGFGFSAAPSRPGLNALQMAIVFKKLMSRLELEKFYCQGGDIGGIILHSLTFLYPESVLGLHTNMPLIYTPKSYLRPVLGLIFPALIVKPEHYERVYPFYERGMFIYKESGYFHLQSTKPDSIGVGLDDSPVALASYVLEKFITGGNFSWINHFDLDRFEAKFPYVNLLDNLMFYWVTGSATTALRFYYESFSDAVWSDGLTILRIPVPVPTIVLRSRYDLYMPDSALDEIYPHLLRVFDYDTGHFPAFEAPELFGRNILESIEIFEKNKQ